MTRALMACGVATCAFAVGLGLYATGGPAEARKVRLDEQRYGDIREIGRALKCASVPLPETLDDVQPCGSALVSQQRRGPEARNVHGMVIIDPVTSEPYAYSRLADGGADICMAPQSHAWQTSPPYIVARLTRRDGLLCVRASAPA